MRLVIALGGNALLKRGEPMLCENQRENVSLACRQIAKAYAGNELVVTHGNGPQVGLPAAWLRLGLSPSLSVFTRGIRSC